MTDLFADADDAHRERLRQLGWTEAGTSTATHGNHGTRYWKRPDGPIFTEEEAFKQTEEPKP